MGYVAVFRDGGFRYGFDGGLRGGHVESDCVGAGRGEGG